MDDEQYKISTQNLCIYACKTGNLELVQMILKYHKHVNIVGYIPNYNYVYDEDDDSSDSEVGKIHYDLLETACEFGQLEVAKFIWTKCCMQNDYKNSHHILIKPCRNGHLNVAKWLYNQKISFVTRTIESAIVEAMKQNHNDVSKWLVVLLNSRLFRNACKSNNLEMAQWLYEKNEIEEKIKHESFILACERGHLLVAQWLYSLNPNLLRTSNDYAFRHSHKNKKYKVVKWLASLCEDYIFTEDTCYIRVQTIGTTTVSNIEICNICYETQSNIITPCGHQFCKKCIEIWYSKNESCPYCRQTFSSVAKLQTSVPET